MRGKGISKYVIQFYMSCVTRIPDFGIILYEKKVNISCEVAAQLICTFVLLHR